MLFNVERDLGDLIEGYLIPDGFSDRPSIIVSGIEGMLARVVCNQYHKAVVESGRHGTGLVGFRIDETVVADLAQREVLAVHDAKSGLLVYRRIPSGSRKNLKIVRLETQIVPSARLDRFCSEGFQYELHSAERFGHETTLQAFHLDTLDSVYISGRLLLKNYEAFLDRGFQAIALLTEPYYEMAARIFLLKKMARSPLSFLGERDSLILTPAAEYFANVDLQSQASLKMALKKAPPKVRGVLTSPMTRQLVCTTPEQFVTKADVAAAIELLSRFTIVSHDNDPSLFQFGISELLGRPAEDIPLPTRHRVLEETALRLREIPAAESLVEHDLIFDHYVRQALRMGSFES